MTKPDPAAPRVAQFNSQLGWIPAIPEPFWHKSWRTLFRYRPECFLCHVRFKTRTEWEQHYVLKHSEEL